MQFEIYKSKGKFRWRLKGDNGEIIASGEGYTRKAKVLEAIDMLKSTNDGVPVEDLTTTKGK
jgi:uncharacterized protein YegP (UPF0339 family)